MTGENVVFIHACAVPAPRVVLEHPSAASVKIAMPGFFAHRIHVSGQFIMNPQPAFKAILGRIPLLNYLLG